MVEDTTIVEKSPVNYLGCMLDYTLRCLQKVKHRIHFLAGISTFLDFGPLKILAGALIHCHLDYACCAWYDGISKTIKLQASQNKLVRIVLRLPVATHLLPSHFERVNWLMVQDSVDQIKSCTVILLTNFWVGSHIVMPLGGTRLTLYPTDSKHLLARKPFYTQQLFYGIRYPKS